MERPPPSQRWKLQALPQEEFVMFGWSVVFAILAVIAGYLGFFALSAIAASIAKILFLVFIVLLVVTFLIRALRGQSVV